MRRASVSLPTRNGHPDPHEKLARYGNPDGAPTLKTKVDNAKTAWMMQSQRSRYLKTGGILLFIVFLFYYLAPKGAHAPVPSDVKGPSGVKVPIGVKGPSSVQAPNVGESTPSTAVVVPPQALGQVASDPSVGTTKCTRSSSPSKPIVQYVLMIDAGSTGSRIHVYRFNNCGATPELESEKFEMTPQAEGGLSSFKADAEGAAKSLDMLMKVAMATVPDKLKSCSPVAVKATAGLRKLGPDLSGKILAAVRNRLETVYPFPVVSEEQGGVEVMEGTDEGVYAWITTNYLLGKIGGPDMTPTAAVFDLGGGSTQIVFEPTFKSPSHGMPEKLAPGDHKYELDFGGRQFELYQHSHMGYGLMAARESIHALVVNSLHTAKPNDKTWLTSPIINPCIAPDMVREVKVDLGADHPLGASVTVNMTGPSSPAPAQCRGLAEKILQKDTECKLAPCSFNGVHQPSLEKTFAREDVYTFSFFYDRTAPLGMPESYTLRELHDLTNQVCHGQAAWDVFSAIPGAIAELQGRPEWCLDLSFMMALLHTGYEMPIDREVKIAKKIKDNELGWCLGASLPLLEQSSGWKCRIHEVTK